MIVDRYDVIVIGAGHAGVEAALASARLGGRVLLATLSLDNVAFMPCNPSIGGPAKGHLVREIDALGGFMGLAIDEAAIQMRLLNTGKGYAVRALRAQADKAFYHTLVKEYVEQQTGLDLKQLMVDEIIIEQGRVQGIRVESGECYAAPCVIIATGTYLRGKIVYGEVSYDSGPNGMRSAMKLSASLLRAGISLRRFKTGTPARLDSRSIDYSKMEIQYGDAALQNFSYLNKVASREQVPCYLTYTNAATHKIIRDNMQRAAMFNGLVEGVGPRYCPSIESKLVRFPTKERHQLFIEPEGLHTKEMYVQGMSSSLPAEVQLAFLRTIPGLEECKMMRPGYAIDYDCLDPLQLKATLEHKEIEGLFSAGQSNGTSGYEEAAGQGLVAGTNAMLKLLGKKPLILGRSDAYIGVLIDDLVTKGTNEPYRMMTSRAEYRLLLRQDNADLRLTEKGRELGLVNDERYALFTSKRDALTRTLATLEHTFIAPNAANCSKIVAMGSVAPNNGISLLELLRRKEITYEKLVDAFGAPLLPLAIAEQVEIEVKYAGYIEKQKQEVLKAQKLENKLLPADFDYLSIKELSSEGAEKLAKFKPISIGQAARISGVSPADVNVLLIALEVRKRKGEE